MQLETFRGWDGRTQSGTSSWLVQKMCVENRFMVRQMVNPRCDELEQIVEVNMQKLSRWVNPYPDSSG